MFRNTKSYLVFLLPGLLGMLIFYVLPFFGGIYYSLTDGSGQARFLGLSNYAAVWSNRMFRLGLANSLVLSLFCAPTVWVLSFLIAALLKKLKKGTGFLRNSILLPYVMPSSAMILIWLLAFDFGGPVNRLLSAAGISRIDFFSGGAMRLSVVLLFVWKNLGFAVVIYLSAMQAVPDAFYEYATLEGAGFFRQSCYITIPRILPTAFLVLILEWVNAFKIFKEVYFISGPYPDLNVYTLQNYMNNMYAKLSFQNVTTAAYSFAAVLFLLFGLLFFAQKKALHDLEGEAA